MEEQINQQTKQPAPLRIEALKDRLKVDESFDIICRTLRVGGKAAAIFFVDGLVKDEVMEKLLEFFYQAQPEDLTDAHAFSKNRVPYIEVDLSGDLDTLCTNVLSGILVLVIEGFDRALCLDVRTYPQRQTNEPDKDKSLRGSHDGFVETLVFNTALIRRRIRDTALRMKIFSVGDSSKSDVVLCYMEDRVDHQLLQKVSDKIRRAQVDALVMNQESLVEAIYHYKWYNPFPKFKYSERPDVTASAVLEGNIVILVDNAPSAVILPTSIFDIVEEPDDYYFPPFTGTYLRLSRYFITFITLVLTPTWLLALQNPSLVPQFFRFVLLEEPPNVPIFWQLILLELAIDGMRLASLNTPSALNTAMSMVAALVLGDYAVESGWFTGECLLYMAFVAIANYSQQSLELGYALKFLRILLLTAVWLFNFWGFIGGLVLVFLLLLGNRTISGKSYLYPLIPFNAHALRRRFFRPRQSRKSGNGQEEQRE